VLGKYKIGVLGFGAPKLKVVSLDKIGVEPYWSEVLKKPNWSLYQRMVDALGVGASKHKFDALRR